MQGRRQGASSQAEQVEKWVAGRSSRHAKRKKKKPKP